ncbi:flagellar basal body rod protein FlgC [Marivivens sp. LCG002]|uniref:flagellar basal body rod protein FlgC n=1 Tax=Marivivens sp. LCG002 TaxID=3051171 RepID=UPI0025563036|nr:flagellar basal body rod protein FlgC [Marivivens sp. LCG002]WIV51261.1 flagellar basal body rod protein FlgC [Marivivens sp. LCG002]
MAGNLNNVFDLAAGSMSSQLVRMNTIASNLANVGTVASTADQAYKTMRPVFETEFNQALGSREFLATPRVEEIVALDREPEQLYRPDHPKANEDGFVFASTVNVEEEMVEMMEASRQYQNTLEAVSTLRDLMARTVNMGK